MTGNATVFEPGSYTAHAHAQASVFFGDGQTLRASGEGRVALSDHNVTNALLLEKVMLVPGCAANLVSVYETAKSLGCTVMFDEHECTVVKDSDIIMQVPVDENNSYTINLHNPTKPLTTVQGLVSVTPSTKSKITAEVWHERLGHPGPHAMQQLVSRALVREGPTEMPSPDIPCHACCTGKATRTPHPKQARRESTAPLQIVHCDLIGPIKPEGLKGMRYVATFVDDYSRFCTAIPIKAKSEAPTTVMLVLIKWQVELSLPVIRIRSDGGGEFCNTQFEQWLTDSRIIHEITIPHNPQMNAKVERLHGTLSGMARSMLSGAQLSNTFWPYAYRTAAYVRNFLPHKALTSTPYALFYGTKAGTPSVKHLRVFGSVCYVKVTTSTKQPKLAPRSHMGRLLGYHEGDVGYLVWIPDRREIVRTRDVVFFEKAPRTLSPGESCDVDVAHGDYQEEQGGGMSTPPLEKPHVDAQTLIDLATLPPTDMQINPSQQPHSIDVVHTSALEHEGGRTDMHVTSGSTHTTGPADGGWVGVHAQEVNTTIVSVLRRSTRNVPRPESYRGMQASAYITQVVDITYAQALDHSNPERDKWRAAIDEEHASIVAHGTFVLVKREPHMKVIPVKWVFSKKLGLDNSVDRYKCRLVAKGFRQREGLEYEDVFAPVSSRSTFRTLMATAVQKGYIVRQLDIKTAFLNGFIEDRFDVYVSQPQGFSQGDQYVCKLVKAIYGLKQAPRVWFTEMNKVFGNHRFHPSIADPALFLREEGENDPTAAQTYVDDFIVICKIAGIYQEIVAFMHAAGWVVKEMGFPQQYLSLDIHCIRNDDVIEILVLHQSNFITLLIEKYGLQKALPASTPMPEKWELESHNLTDSPILATQKEYASLVGALLYVAVCTRPDIAFAVNHLARYTREPRQAHWDAAKRVMLYLKGTSTFGLAYRRDGNPLFEVFSDADYAGNRIDRRSITGYLVKLNGAAVSWSSKRQTTVACSTAEAEYQAMSATAREMSWIRLLRSELNLPCSQLVMRCDNQAAICWSEDWKLEPKAKHIDVMHHFVREQVENGSLLIEYVSTDEQCADPLTKSLPVPRHLKAIGDYGLMSFKSLK